MPKPKKTARSRHAAAAPPRSPVPPFASEAEERAFWQEQDTADTSTGPRPNARGCRT